MPNFIIKTRAKALSMTGTQYLTLSPLYGIEELKGPNYCHWGELFQYETAVGKTAAKTSAGASGIFAGC